VISCLSVSVSIEQEDSGTGSIKTTVQNYRKEAANGSAAAQFKLGFCFEIGYGVPRDVVEAIKWFRLAAEQGYAAAMLKLNVLLKSSQADSKVKPRKIVRRDKVVYAEYAIDVSTWDSHMNADFALDTMTVLEHEVCVTVSSNAAARVSAMCEEHGWEKEIIVTVCCNYFGDSRDLSGMALTPTVFFEPAGVVFCNSDDSLYNAHGEFQGVSLLLPSYACAESHWDVADEELATYAAVLTTSTDFLIKADDHESPAAVPFHPADWKVSDEHRDVSSVALNTTDVASQPPSIEPRPFAKHAVIKRQQSRGTNRDKVVMFRVNLLHFTGEVIVALSESMKAGTVLTALTSWDLLFPWRVSWKAIFSIPRSVAHGNEYDVHFWVSKSLDGLDHSIFKECYTEVAHGRSIECKTDKLAEVTFELQESILEPLLRNGQLHARENGLVKSIMDLMMGHRSRHRCHDPVNYRVRASAVVEWNTTDAPNQTRAVLCVDSDGSDIGQDEFVSVDSKFASGSRPSEQDCDESG
jgi:hypothetical protein